MKAQIPFQTFFRFLIGSAFALMPVVTPCYAEGDVFSNWFERVAKIQAEQPSWMTPVFTTTSRLDEEIHYDQSIQTAKSGARVDNYGSSKGLELIPFQNVQLNLGVPPWIARDKPSNKDGFGDESFLVKYRFLSGNKDRGNYVLTGFLGLTVPTS